MGAVPVPKVFYGHRGAGHTDRVLSETTVRKCFGTGIMRAGGRKLGAYKPLVRDYR